METTAALPGLDALTLARLEAAFDAVSSVPLDVGALEELSEAALLAVNRIVAATRDAVRMQGALIAGEMSRRSAPELGSDGLAQRAGFRTPEELVRVTTRSSGREAVTAVRAGRLLVEEATTGQTDAATGEILAPSQPWLAPLVAALRAGLLSVDAVDAIRSGLGVPTSAVTIEQLTTAAERLCEEARVLDPDRLFKRARQVRDELDAAGVVIREAERRQQRSLRVGVLPSGMGRLVWVMDPETFAAVKETFDRATSPKRGGVRFVEGPNRARAEKILADDRTVDQLASDAFAELLQLGAAADPEFLIGRGASQVRVIVTKEALAARVGSGHLEGQTDPVSIDTVERLGCSGGMTEVVFGAGRQPLDVGREQRHFTARQRVALAVRDGGCRWPGCERPPSWTEAHHTRFWARDHGPTDTAVGILLCRHHHLLAHNNGWEIHARDGGFVLVPPISFDPDQKPVAMPSNTVEMSGG